MPGMRRGSHGSILIEQKRSFQGNKRQQQKKRKSKKKKNEENFELNNILSS